MSSYRLTRQAEDDLIDIFLYSIEQFGPQQAARYKEELKSCFALLATRPRMGRPAATIAEGVRRHEHRSHVILYELQDDLVLILAVIHASSIRRLEI